MLKTGKTHHKTSNTLHSIYIVPDYMIRCNPAYLFNIPLIINPFTNQNQLL
jgi:hypothetical protein